ncbi:hypothetical protein Micbo1qcDRAFT_201571 [Microdochium bolleyi]|uniref:Heterokaryon incompatibility domain-containing protein n=1 Tax=Microdochium bolleyi TaxID=196109 RepID=A0A136JGM5_9PEZI|nr:hypothetical protein Micbo1qcDRAFT_201571 [Microdochium bolleyi]
MAFGAPSFLDRSTPAHPPLGSNGFRLIDCAAAIMIVEAQPLTVDYAALSYVWSASTDVQVELKGLDIAKAIHSRMLLLFTQKGLVWECAGMTAHENVRVLPPLSHLPDSTRSGSWAYPGHFERINAQLRCFSGGDDDRHNFAHDETRELHRIRRDFVQYSSRDLTYGTDSLLAFQGIMQMYSSRRPGCP